MAAGVTPMQNRVGAVPAIAIATDLADVWLGHALASLLEACGVPEETRDALLVSGGVLEQTLPTPATTDEAEELERLDASRRAVVFAALALEARINRVLSRCDPEERLAFARLAPAQRFRLAPRLLDELEFAREDAALCDLVVEVFAARDELVDAHGALTRPTAGPSVDRARAIVEESAKVCGFLATLTEDVRTGPARKAWTAAGLLAGAARGAHPSSGAPLGLPQWDWDWSDQFPPSLVGS